MSDDDAAKRRGERVKKKILLPEKTSVKEGKKERMRRDG